MTWIVTWVTDIDECETPREAAEAAFDLIQQEGTLATVFTVENAESGEQVMIDLLDMEDGD